MKLSRWPETKRESMPKHTHKKNIDIVVVALSSPLYIGLYEDNRLVDILKSEQHTSEALPVIFEELDGEYEIENIFYAKGPGSFMSIKVAYIFLKSFSIIKNIPLFATDAFYFNHNSPIKAVGKLYFVKIDDSIQTRKLDSVQSSGFSLPKILEKNDFDTHTSPQYGIGAVY
jgi:tRNA A37 threonylcarbamoyladenosine modification protein TsaB